MSDTLVRSTFAEGVRTLTLDSQHNRNALSRALVAQLLEGIEAAGEDPDTRVLVIAAEGKAFCAGADLSEMTSADDAARADGTAAMLAMIRAVVACPRPVVTRVHAPVRAGGIGLVAASDIAIASTEATFALSEVRLGLAPAIISLPVAPRMTPRAAARTWLTGEVFDGAAAAEHGLVTTAVAPDELDAEVARVVGDLAKSPVQGLAETKRLLTGDLLARIDAGGETMQALSARLFGSEVAQELMSGFLKR